MLPLVNYGLFLQEAPKDKLLIYDVKQGWEPLCTFLDKKIPEKPFPWKNVGGKGYLSESYKKKFQMQVLKELCFVLLMFLALFAAAYLYIHEYETWMSFLTIFLSFLIWLCYLQS